MIGTMRRLACLLIGAHLLLGAVFLVMEATHGINDRDVSFAIALLFYYANYPAVQLLRFVGFAPSGAAVLLAGVAQWTAVAAVLAAAGDVVVRALVRRTGASTRDSRRPDVPESLS